MRLVFYTYSYTDRLNLPIDDTLARVAQTGYCGIDESSTFGKHLNSSSVSAQRRAEIRAAAAKHRLRIEAIVTHGDLTTSLYADEKLDLRASIDLAADLGGDVVTFHLGGSVAGISDQEVWKKTVQEIQQAADYGDRKHVRLAIDCGPWPVWIVKHNDDLAKLFADVGSKSFGVNFDPCYLAVAGIDSVGFVARFGDRIRHAHLKDHRGRYPDFQHRIPGKGELDYVSLIKALKQAKFQDALAIECFIDMPLVEACDIGFATLKEAFDKAGVPMCPAS